MPAGVQDVRPVFLHFVLFFFLKAFMLMHAWAIIPYPIS